MEKYEFEEFLHKQIPITKSMGFSVDEFKSSRVKVSAKLELNINHKSTAFGGSINSLMTICGWAMVFIHIKEVDPNAHIVIQKSNINYLAPITEDFVAECTFNDENVKSKFIHTYNRKGKGRLSLKVSCYKEDTLLAEFEGQYVAFK